MDRNELVAWCERLIAAVETLGKKALAEESAACMPSRSVDGPISGGGPSDVTQRLATGGDRGPAYDHDPTVPNVDESKYRERDRIASVLARADFLVREADNLRPVKPSRDCLCCRRDSATQWRDEDGVPRLCDPCDQFRRAHRHLCDERVHEQRGQVEWCQCPSECCPGGCGKRADDGAFAAECRAYIDARRTA